jgi:hypothetical protein
MHLHLYIVARSWADCGQIDPGERFGRSILASATTLCENPHPFPPTWRRRDPANPRKPGKPRKFRPQAVDSDEFGPGNRFPVEDQDRRITVGEPQPDTRTAGEARKWPKDVKFVTRAPSPDGASATLTTSPCGPGSPISRESVPKSKGRLAGSGFVRAACAAAKCRNLPRAPGNPSPKRRRPEPSPQAFEWLCKPQDLVGPQQKSPRSWGSPLKGHY